MKKCLCSATVLFLFSWGAACGDLSEIEDERIREFVKTAKRVIIDELMTDGNTQDEIDDKIDVLVDAIKGDSGGGVTPPPIGVPVCRETGRKTVVMFRDPAGHVGDYLKDTTGFDCTMSGDGAICSDGEDVCTCTANDTMNPAGSTSFTATCTEDGGSGDTFNFTDAETLNYDAPTDGGGTTPPPTSGSDYSIKEQNQNQKSPGMVFPITIVDSSGATVAPDAQASLAAYNSSGSEIDDAIATWKAVSGDNIYDVNVAAGVSASFDVFLVRGTSGVAELGGTVDGTAINKVTLTAGSYADASDVVVINDTTINKIRFMFSGAARTALNSSNKAMEYIVIDANGEVQSSVNVGKLPGLDIPGANGTTFVGQADITGNCIEGEYVLIRFSNNLNKVYLPRCQALP